MKKIIALLMAMAMVLSLAVCASAATVATGINVVAEEDATGIVTVTVSAANVSDFSGLKLGLDFDESKVSLLHTDKATVATTTSSHADVVEVVDAGYAAMASHNVTIKDTHIIVNDFVSAVEQWFDTTDNVLIKLYFKKAEGATLDDTSFVNYYKITATTYYKTGTTQMKSNVEGNFGYTVIPYAPIVEEDKFINDETATGGSTLTFYGRIGADWIGEDYGVIIEGKDFFGAKPGDTVADVDGTGATTFEFDTASWDGTFKIVLTNITEKGTAGEKTYQFFVGENVTEAATVVVE